MLRPLCLCSPFCPHGAFQAGSALGSALMYSAAALQLTGVKFGETCCHYAGVNPMQLRSAGDDSNFYFKQKQLLEAPEKRGKRWGHRLYTDSVI